MERDIDMYFKLKRKIRKLGIAMVGGGISFDKEMVTAASFSMLIIFYTFYRLQIENKGWVGWHFQLFSSL
jgi:hypothetical protein